ncbi:hypothetical protein K458DRAFT_12950 [Lentithecium fluviatile CBS 122367]|uniref:Uncharacterized protein n=1 Tax=Lentithecium fluviatile CBS 122367 TaxID=1168545 RepID=A0A6G1J4N8_9PLEO|nr:hypothetical protein K458DRAFT_12950 [Lentithecium fluviatile CBS 122367]
MAETRFSRLVMRLSPMVETRNEGPCFVRPSGAAKRSQAGKKTRTPLVEGQGGGTPSGECTEGGECLAVMFERLGFGCD